MGGIAERSVVTTTASFWPWPELRDAGVWTLLAVKASLNTSFVRRPAGTVWKMQTEVFFSLLEQMT